MLPLFSLACSSILQSGLHITYHTLKIQFIDGEEMKFNASFIFSKFDIFSDDFLLFTKYTFDENLFSLSYELKTTENIFRCLLNLTDPRLLEQPGILEAYRYLQPREKVDLDRPLTPDYINPENFLTRNIEFPFEGVKFMFQIFSNEFGFKYDFFLKSIIVGDFNFKLDIRVDTPSLYFELECLSRILKNKQKSSHCDNQYIKLLMLIFGQRYNEDLLNMFICLLLRLDFQKNFIIFNVCNGYEFDIPSIIRFVYALNHEKFEIMYREEHISEAKKFIKILEDDQAH